MVSRQQAVNVLADLLGQLEPKQYRIRGILGYPGSTTVEVSGRDGYVYFQEDGNPSKVFQIFNNKVAPIPNLPVVAGVDAANPNTMQVLDIDMGALPDWGGRSFPIPHHKSHELGSQDSSGNALDTDVVFVRSRQYVPLALRPNNPNDYSLYVYPDWYWYGSELKRWDGGPTQNYAIPTVADTAYYVLTSLDSNNQLSYITGQTFSPTLSISGSRHFIPDPALGTYPLGAVYLPYGDTSLSYDNIELTRPYSFTPGGHLRLTGVSITGGPFVLPTGTSISGSAGGAPGQLIYDTDDDTLYISDGTYYQSVGGTAVVANSVTKTVGAGKDFTTIQGAIDWFKGKIVRGTCKISVDAGSYDEAVEFSDIITGKSGALELEGDTRELAGLTYVAALQPSAWVGSTGYTAGDTVRPTAGQNGFFYVATTGTSAVGEPTWPTTIGGTVVDNDITWTCHGVLANRAGLTNGGSGSCQIDLNALDGTGTIITVRCSTTNPDFEADGWVNGDKILLFFNMAGGVTLERTISSVSGNAITVTSAITAGLYFYDSSALCLEPNRRIDRTAAGPCIEVTASQGVTIDGWYLEPTTGVSCHGIYVEKGALVNTENVAIRAEDYGIYADYGGHVIGDDGAVSLWNCLIGILTDRVSDVSCVYMVGVDNTYGIYAGTFTSIIINYGIAVVGTYGVFCEGHSLVYGNYVTVRYCTTGYFAQSHSFVNVGATSTNNYGNTTNYNPAPSIPGSAQGNHYAVIYVS